MNNKKLWFYECYLVKDTNHLNIKCICKNIISEKIIILHKYYYNPLTTDNGTYQLTSGKGTLAYSTEGLRISGSGGDTFFKNMELTLPSNYEMELTIVDYNNGWSGDICLEDFFMNIAAGACRKLSNSGYNYGAVLSPISKGSAIKFVRQGTTIKVYYDNVLQGTYNNIGSTGIHQFKTYNGRYLIVKNLIITEL